MHQTAAAIPLAPSSQSSSGGRPRRSTRRRQKYNETAAEPSSSSSNAAILWIILLVGLVFCLIDVAYILSYVDTQHAAQQGSEETAPNSNQESPDSNKKKQQQDEDESPFDNNIDYSIDKGPIIQILNDAGLFDIDNETMKELPTWSEVRRLYGDEPRIYGLETCEAFQKHSDPADHFVSTAGSFNSGTNLMAELLIHNCHNPARQKKYGYENRGVRWQVPWGKHNPPGDEEFRQTHKTEKDANVDAKEILPAVTIRDPYVWMNSMCRHKYTANWAHNADKHCPNLVPNQEDWNEFPRLRGQDHIPVRVNYAERTIQRQHESLAHMWNDWYNEYKHVVDFPRLIVRFEDLMFHAKAVTKAVCECAGGELDKHHPFKYVVESAKRGPNAHGPMHLRTGFVQAIIRYGKDKGRLDRYTEDDLKYAKKVLDRDLMEFFRYIDPPVDVDDEKR